MLNPYELIRKYECSACGAVMMCTCDETYGRRALPHQLRTGTRLETKERVRVTHGFVANICNTCRGLPEAAAPKAEMHGRTSKILRYYWREIAKETSERFARWAQEQGLKPSFELRGEHRPEYERIHAEAVAYIKAQHEQAPKYQYAEQSGDEVIRRYAVEVFDLDATYVKPATKGQTIIDGDRVISVEAFASSKIEDAGFKVLRLESLPLHVLFAVLLYPLITDERDPDVREVFFGQRDPSPGERTTVGAFLPSDFGAVGYGSRRRDAIAKYFEELPKTSKELVERFESLFGESWPLRQYLWAHKPEDAKRALALLDVLPADRVHAILRFLVEHYWGRYLGWPDLIAYDAGGYFFAEVKGSGDKLSEDQKAWIEGNARELRLPFKIYKVHRHAEVDRSVLPGGSADRP